MTAANRDPSEAQDDAAKASALAAVGKGCFSAILFGLGPTLVFVLTYVFAPVSDAERIYAASAALTAAVVVAVIIRYFRPLPDNPVMPWRNLLIIAMAGLTVALHDDLFVKVRPTVTNIVGALIASATLAGFRPRLDGILNRKSVSLGDAAWRKLTVGSVLLGILMAAANEYVRRFKSEAFWVYFQLWGPPLFFGTFLMLGFLVIRRDMPAGQCPAKPRTDHSEPSNDL